jgi:hypothetical protein
MQRIDYGGLLARANPQLALDKAEYLFHPGMLFESGEKWWGDLGRRHAPHEGIDLCLYRSGSGRFHPLPPETAVPVFAPGRILAVIDDFLGRTVFVQHEIPQEPSRPFLSIYAHIIPLPDIEAGLALDAGRVIGRISDSPRLPSGMLPHLHLSVGHLAPGLDAASLSWPRLNKREGIHLLDPLASITLPKRTDRILSEELLIARS